MTLQKHAYLIMAHNEFKLLEKLIEVLDDERNNIYIHIDLKSKINIEDKIKVNKYKSSIYFVERMKVNWGSSSQIQCELNLLKAATEKSYDYYHLISGADFPLKNQNEIHDFFNKNSGKEFVHFDSEIVQNSTLSRVRFYHLLQDINFFTRNKSVRKIRDKTNDLLIYAQKVMGIDRIKNAEFSYMKGANWFSITNEFAKYVVSKEQWILKTFSNTICGDEMFLQTLIYNSEFKDNLYSKKFNNDYLSILRYIDWEKGNPYTWGVEDFDILKNSSYLFARKFSLETDSKIVDKLNEYISSEK